jgi:predicted O-linked N-acetylglucosamine transferase (SPINDLY family)
MTPDSPIQPTVEQAMALALQKHQAGNLADAEKIYRDVLEREPGNRQALHLLGIIAFHTGRTDLAIEMIGRAIVISPAVAALHSNLGNALRQKRRLDDAANAYREAIRIDPNFAAAHINLGNILLETSKFEQAIEAYRRALQLAPENAAAHYNLGIALRKSGFLDDAAAAYREAIKLKADQAEVFHELGLVLRDQGLHDESIAAARRAVALKPDSPHFHSNLILRLHYHPESTPALLLHEARQWGRKHSAKFAQTGRPPANDPDRHRPLKIGYVSPDFRNHPVGRFILPLMEGHDARQFQIHCYARTDGADEMTRRIRSCARVWRDTVGMSDEQLAEQIRADGIDLLVDLSSHTAFNRLLVFARKPAPVQVTYLAYPGTTGIETMDYRITDDYLDPPGISDEFYCETSVRVKSYWCYRSPIEDLEVTAPPAAKAGFVMFGCLNAFRKVTTATLETWSTVLSAVPNSQILIHAEAGSHRRRVQDFFQARGIDPRRIAFTAMLPLKQYMQQYSRIDIALDPFPFGGGTTSCDALWVGVPVITLLGRTAVGRGGVSILSNAGFADFIAGDTADYIRRAVELAGDLTRLKELRSNQRERMQNSRLMDEQRFVSDFELALRWMWQEWCSQSASPASRTH